MLKILSYSILFLSIALLTYYFYPSIEEWLREYQSSQRIKKTSNHLGQMFIKLPLSTLVYITFLTPFILGVIGFLISGSFFVAFICVGFGVTLPSLFIKNFQKRRLKKFEAQLVDGLTSLSSSLRGGLSFLQAVEVLVEELPPPISQEFSLILIENKLGIPLEESLQKLARRMKSEPLSLTIRAVLIARQSGGDLTAVFSQIVNTIKERNKLEQRINTLTSQGRMQGMLMGVLPIIFAAVVSTTNPSLIQTMLEEPAGQAMLIYALISEIIGVILIRRVCRIEI
ncbi:MAG: type II secretion system F family protein [Candidatus Omnitrophica bacterium]|nr:type II secretion system F family protein [Candidatus Omnitrophota bacterium]